MDPSPPLPQQSWRQSESQPAGRLARKALPPPTGASSTASTPHVTPFGTPQQTPGSESLPVFPGFSASRTTSTTTRPRPSLPQFPSFDSSYGAGPSSYLSTPADPAAAFPGHSRTGSASHLLSPESSFNYDDPNHPPTPDPYTGGPAAPPQPPRAYRPWRERWLRRLQDARQPYYAMFGMLALGLVGAAAHHGFYASLDGREAADQYRMLRYGAALSFLTKSALAGAVAIAFRQRVWLSVRRRVFSVAAIDSLFAANEDMTALLNWEVFRAAKLAMCLAVFIWLTPLVVILTSDTLTVQQATISDQANCSSVHTLNLTQEGGNDWRLGTKINGQYEMSVSFWNNTSPDVTDPNFFDYWDQPSSPFTQIVDLAIYLKRPLSREGNHATEICGGGWNCSFVVNFTAPGYKCEELASGVGSTARNLGDAANPLNTSMLIPEGQYSYFAVTDRGEYASQQIDSGNGGVPNGQPPYPSHLGAFRTEPIIWIGYSVLADPSKPIPTNSSDPAWSTGLIPKIMGCEHYTTAYRVQFNHTAGGTQATTVLSRDFLRPVLGTTFDPLTPASDGTLDNTTAFPTSAYVYPARDIPRYRIFGAYHSLGLALRRKLHGSIDATNIDVPITRTAVTNTRLVDDKIYLPVPDLQDAVQSLYEDVVLSLFSSPRFISVVWAARPDTPSGAAPGTLAETGYPCTRERRTGVFDFHRRDLWLVYGAAFLLALVGVALGLMAVGENGGEFRGTRFSNIVEATRGPGLDRVHGVGAADEEGMGSRGEGPGPGRVRLGYGLVQRAGLGGAGPGRGLEWEGGAVMYGFGVEGQVRQASEEARVSKRFSRVLDRKDGLW